MIAIRQLSSAQLNISFQQVQPAMLFPSYQYRKFEFKDCDRAIYHITWAGLPTKRSLNFTIIFEFFSPEQPQIYVAKWQNNLISSRLGKR